MRVCNQMRKTFTIITFVFCIHGVVYSQIDTNRRTLLRVSIGSLINRSCSHYRHSSLAKEGRPEIVVDYPSDNPERYYGFLGSIEASFKTYQPYLRFNLGVNYTYSKGRYKYYYDETYTDKGGINIIQRKDVLVFSNVHRAGIEASMEYRFFNAFYFNFGPCVSYQLISKDILNGYQISGNVVNKSYVNSRIDNYNKFNPVFVSLFLKTGYDFKVRTKSIGLFAIINGFFDYRASYLGLGMQIHL